MHVLGVSDGTCNQINPYIFEPANICGAGAAGGNRCLPDAYPQAYGIENFSTDKFYCDSCNITEFVIGLLLLVLLIGAIYSKYSKKDLI
jgi:hypothetical protein